MLYITPEKLQEFRESEGMFRRSIRLDAIEFPPNHKPLITYARPASEEKKLIKSIKKTNPDCQ